jgi:hypothetical protein
VTSDRFRVPKQAEGQQGGTRKGCILAAMMPYDSYRQCRTESENWSGIHSIE